MSVDHGFRVGIALNRLGWHPATLRSSSADFEALFTGSHWSHVAQEVAQSGLDFVTLEDKLSLYEGLPTGPRTAKGGGFEDNVPLRLRGQLDPVVVAAVMLATSDVGEVVVARNVTHTKPFQVATQLASLAAIGPGRVAWRPQVSADFRDAVIVGGVPTPRLDGDGGYVPTRIAKTLRGLFDEAETCVRTVRRLWAADELPSEVTFGTDGERGFRATGPIPVPMTAPPAIAVLAHHALEPYRLASAVADRVFVTPTSQQPIETILAALEQVQDLTPDPMHPQVYADIAVVLGDTEQHAHRRLEQLNERAGQEWSTDTSIFVGTPATLAHRLATWQALGLTGARLRPAVMAVDGARITADLAPLLIDASGGLLATRSGE